MIYDSVQVSGKRDAGKGSAVQLVTVTVTPPSKERLPYAPTTDNNSSGGTRRDGVPGTCNGDPWIKTEQETSQGGADEAKAHQGGAGAAETSRTGTGS